MQPAAAAPSASPAAARSQLQPMQQTAAASAAQQASARAAAAKARRLSAAGASAGAGSGTANDSQTAAGKAAAGIGAAGAQATGGAAAPADFSGLWVKDAARSDSRGYEAMLDVLGLSSMQKMTARLIEGIEIQQTASKFIVNFVTVVPFFKVTEEVPLNGGSTQQRRRDLRQGRQTAAARSVSSPEQQGVLVEMSWGAPLEGSLTELYSLLPDGCLAVAAETRVGPQQAKAVTVYRRSAGSRDALLADSRRRNGSMADVLRKQQDQR
ncbi:hypothetical protein COO60DRAFT_1554152 [Scenedesmus sp. NREL 46B-D3]|nr:hypothetical protein COO60DRAFT_1554152 [Scenedesmus sp. NREL 46B-D3]